MTRLSHSTLAAEAARWTADRAAPMRAAADARGRRGRGLSLLVRFASWAAVGLLLGLVILVGSPYLMHGSALTVMSGSMEPAISTGDAVVTRGIKPLDVRVGDVITFKRADDSGILVTHRVRKLTVTGDWASFVTKGDANTDVERWRIRTDGELGRVLYRIPNVGYVLYYMGSGVGTIVFVLLPLTILSIAMLRRIWR